MKWPANDNANEPQIRIEGLESPPLAVVEMEIFDALISNIKLLVANDNDAPPLKEKNP
jgi:hypothetical protein